MLLTGIQTSMRNFPENFSVSGAVFLGVQGTLLLVIIMIITSIVVIVCSLIKSRTGERSHSIRGEKVIQHLHIALHVLSCGGMLCSKKVT